MFKKSLVFISMIFFMKSNGMQAQCLHLPEKFNSNSVRLKKFCMKELLLLHLLYAADHILMNGSTTMNDEQIVKNLCQAYGDDYGEFPELKIMIFKKLNEMQTVLFKQEKINLVLLGMVNGTLLQR